MENNAEINFSNTIDYSVVKDKTALITGGAGGIGFGIATELAKNGARVAILDLNEESGHFCARQLEMQGLTARFVQADPSSWDSQDAAFKAVLAWSENHLDIVVPCAGLPLNNLSPYITPDEERPESGPRRPPESTIMANLVGSYYTTSLALFYFNKLAPLCQTPRWAPQLVFISSIAGYESIPFGADYVAAKFGVRGLWKTIRKPGAGMTHYQANLLAPLSTRTGKTAEEALERANFKLNEVADVVAGAMRCICDISIEGRAVACPLGKPNAPGSENFDLCDDLGAFAGGRVLLQKLNEGVFGNLMPPR